MRVVAVATLVFMPASVVFGQGIAGVVKDTSGGVLPGVTVEASSPALIEKARTVVSDAQGQYSIIDLRPGVYTVTFVLPGFSTVRREGIVLTTGFTANVSAELAVGALGETILVSAEAPVVDTRTVRQIAILTNEVIETLPTGTRQRNVTHGRTGRAGGAIRGEPDPFAVGRLSADPARVRDLDLAVLEK